MSKQVQAAKLARRAIEQVRQLLLHPTPEAVAACAAPLGAAIQSLESVEAVLRAGGGAGDGAGRELRSEVVRLRRELGQAAALLRTAAEFHEGWGRLLKAQGEIGVDYDAAGVRVSEPSNRGWVLHG